MTKPAIGTVLFRVTGFVSDFHQTSEACIEYCTVVKHTPKGVWLKRPYYKKLKFMLDDMGRYANPTIEEAMKAFTHRRLRYIAILENNLAHAQYELERAKSWKPEHQRFYKESPHPLQGV